MNPRVLILSENMPAPPDRRVMAEATSLADEGFSVSVICPSAPGQPLREVIGGVRFFRYRQPPGGNGLLGYLFEYGLSLLHACRLTLVVAAGPGFDVMQGCNPPDLFFLLGGFAKLFGKRYIFDQHDLSPEVYSSRFDSPRRAVLRVLHAAEKASYRTADAVLVTNESYRRIAIDRGGIDAEKTFVVRNGPRLDWLARARVREPYRCGKQRLVLYTGVMGPQDGVGDFLRAAAHVLRHRDDVAFALVGDGDERESLEAYAAELGIKDAVHFAGWVSDEAELASYLATADVCVSPEPPNPLNEVSTFVKVAEYLAAGKPVVAYDLPETRYTAGAAARYASPGDWEQLGEEIERVIAQPELARAMSEAASARLPDLVWERQVRTLVAAYRFAMRRERSARLLAPIAVDDEVDNSDPRA